VAQKVGYAASTRKSRNSDGEKKVKSVAFVSCLGFSPWGEHYFGQILKGCVGVCQQSEIALQVAEINENISSSVELPVSIRDRKVDGFVVVGWPTRELVNKLVNNSQNAVFVEIKNVFDGINHIRPDHAGGTIKSVQYLHECGHSKIGVIAGDMRFDCEHERLMAYKMAMEQLELPLSEMWVVKEGVQGEISGYNGMKKLFKQAPELTAVLCHGDLIARGAITAAKEIGMDVPKDVSIIGFDNQSFSSETHPPLTTVDVALVSLGRVAVSRLMELSNQKDDIPPQRITLETKLIERNSVSGPRIK